MKKMEMPPAPELLLAAVDQLLDKPSLALHIIGNTELIRSINNDYAYWDKVNYKVPNELRAVISPEDLWYIIKFNRQNTQHSLFMGGESFFFTSTDSLYGQLHEFDLHLGGSLGGQAILSDVDRHHYLIGSIMEESIASSQIEGAVTSRVVAKDMLRKQRPPRNESERMIVNNYNTIQHIVAHKQD